MASLTDLLNASAALHDHLCPRQVLGVRMGLLAGKTLGLTLPQTGKCLLTVAETDGCGADGIAVATNCWVGRRTMRVVDFGKMAATFVDTHSDRTIRIAPRLEARDKAIEFAPEAADRWEAQLLGYQRMPDNLLLSVQPVSLTTPVHKIISQPGLIAICQTCGEEIMNQREVLHEGSVLCRACAGAAYYQAIKSPVSTGPSNHNGGEPR